jgi:hypothetical protein
MSTFEQSRGLLKQTHFTVVEIDLPSVTGTCTIAGEPGFGTPLSCDQPSDGITTYKFTQDSAPLLPESGILRMIKSISETPAKLNSGRGLSSRGTGSVSMFDITGKDPNPNAPAVTAEIKAQGGYLAKLIARNELTNKNIRIKNYRVEVDGTIDLLNGAETRHYIIDSVVKSKSAEYSFKFKDELSRVNIDESVWPLPLEGFLVNDITDTQTTFNVDPNVTYLIADTIRISDEFMKITGVANIGTGTANITVQTRGNPIIYTNQLTKTLRDEHSLGDEIFVCEVSDAERIDTLLKRILVDIGVDASYIPDAAWAAEIDLWHPTTLINTIWFESVDTAETLEKILTDYMIDMWFDPVARLVKITAISSWQESTSSLNEGNQIDFESITTKREESLRSTRALAIYDKTLLASDNGIENFSKASLFVRTELESTDVFGEPKTKKFNYSVLLDKDGADLLVNRWVNRYSDPVAYNWTTQERKLTFNTGDVVDVTDLSTVDFAGAANSISRAQITSIRPSYTQYGREYKVTGLSYEPNFVTGTEIIITGNASDINLYIQYAGAPSAVVDLTFIFDASLVGSTGNSLPAIRAGAFAAGSKITIIMVNGADLQAAGGGGGKGGGGFYDPKFGWLIVQPESGIQGGIVYNAEGVTTDIYFSGATGNANYPTADGYIRAPSGGAGGFSGFLTDPPDSSNSGGSGGKGGGGRSVGLGGQGGSAVVTTSDVRVGTTGQVGSVAGPWGLSGANNNATGGLAGSGVVDDGATVTFFGDTPTRYINGNGDHV